MNILVLLHHAVTPESGQKYTLSSLLPLGHYTSSWHSDVPVHALVLRVIHSFRGSKSIKVQKKKKKKKVLSLSLMFTRWWISEKLNKILITWAGRRHSEAFVWKSVYLLTFMLSHEAWTIRRRLPVAVSSKASCPSGATAVQTGRCWGYYNVVKGY